MYATVDELREYSPQTPTEAGTPGTDALLESVLIRATAMINDALAAKLGARSFTFAEYGIASTKLITAYGGEYLSLPAHQIGSVTLVEYQTGWSPAAYTTLNADYWDEEADGRLYYPSGWALSPHNARWRVTAKWGYGPAPASITQLCLELAVNIWRSKDKGSFTENIGVDGSGGVRFVGGFTRQQQDTIENVVAQWWVPSI